MAMMFFNGCAEWRPQPFTPSSGHIATPTAAGAGVPRLAGEQPLLPEPEPSVPLETYTVAVNNIPVQELLFALARDAGINVDIDPTIDGVVTLNAVDQTLTRILDRVSRQVSMRYDLVGDHLTIQPDLPFFRIYTIDYLNVTRDTGSAISIATQIATTGVGFAGGDGGNVQSGGGNNSTTAIKSNAVNHFWNTLTENVKAVLTDDKTTALTGSSTGTVIPSPEAGLLTVKATARQHELIRSYLDELLTNVNRQVLIQATIVEVDLKEEYQAGIDWTFLNNAAGLSLTSATLPGAAVPTALSLFQLIYEDADQGGVDKLKVTINLLDEFGKARVLSSPQLMVLNNQTAVLKVVDNEVFFTIEAKTTQNQTGAISAVETSVHTVPVGIVMPVTPQISANGSVILNVRPTISRVVDRVEDPNPTLRFAPDGTPLDRPVTSAIPQIRVREMESILRMRHGQIAVLGGLMQNSEVDNDGSIPGLASLPLVGELFSSHSRISAKTELVIFIRPTIVHNPGINADLRTYQEFLSGEQIRQPASPEQGHNVESGSGMKESKDHEAQ